MPAKALEKPLSLLPGDGLRESGEDGGEAGGAGSRVLERVLRPLALRPDSSM